MSLLCLSVLLSQLKDAISAKAMKDFVGELEASGADPEVIKDAKKNLGDMNKRDEKLLKELQVLRNNLNKPNQVLR